MSSAVNSIPSALQTTGCHVQLEMVDGPHGLVFGRLLLSGSPDGCTYAQFLIGQRLAAAASFQLDGTTYFSTAGMAMHHDCSSQNTS